MNKPNFGLHPGWHLATSMEMYKLSQQEVANKTGISVDNIQLILDRKMDVDNAIAKRLSRVFYSTTTPLEWMELQRDYNQCK